MGGAGSENRWGDGARQKCEDLLDLRISVLRKNGLLETGRRGSLVWNVGGRACASIETFMNGQFLELTYYRREFAPELRRVHEIIPLEITEQPFGGERRWFICPRCDRRCAVLYAGEGFSCRLCLNLGYRSQYEDPRFRFLSKARKLRQRLGGSGNMMLPFPDKPRGMHRAMFERLYDRGRALEQAGLRALARSCLHGFSQR
ncbi:hypothetical protein [Mesorhizobium salmacidum]|uniref:Uncharacterized protein n=1 Tax=Mesorhizobium salmacidum TaxID=3015171 RepID=A0ABU8KYS0_9HYPH